MFVMDAADTPARYNDLPLDRLNRPLARPAGTDLNLVGR
jgi:hypothetical protein